MAQARYVVAYGPPAVLGVKEFLSWHDVLKMSPGVKDARLEKSFRFWYDPARTTINSVRLTWTATNTCWWNGFVFLLDGSEVARAEWGAELGTRSGETYVTDLFTAKPANGHVIEAFAWKFYWPYAFYCEVSFTATLTVDFTGDQPGVEVAPPPPTPWDYLKWAFILGGIAIVGFLGLKVIQAVRKKS